MSVWRQSLMALSLVIQLGLMMSVGVYLGYRGGSWLDQVMGTSLTFTLIGTLLGIGGGFVSIYRLLVRVMQRHADDNDG